LRFNSIINGKYEHIGFPEKPDAQPDTPTPFWINMLTKISQFISPLTLFRIMGHNMGINLLKFLRPDFKRQYTSLIDNPDLVYNYLYYLNNQTPRY
jgi:hypothetical protein